MEKVYQGPSDSSSNCWRSSANFRKLVCFCTFNPRYDVCKELFQTNMAVTIGYMLLYLIFGVNIGFLGPTLDDFACWTNQPIKSVSLMFFAQTFMMLVGVLVSGILIRWISPDFLLLFCAGALPILILMASFSEMLTLLTVIMAFMGLLMGAIDCLTNLQLVSIYGHAVGPFIQTLHFCYGLGALISPLVVTPFVGENCTAPLPTTMPSSTNTSDSLTTAQFGLTALGNTTRGNDSSFVPSSAHEETRVFQALWVLAALQVPLVIYLLIIFSKKGLTFSSNHNENKIPGETKPILNGGHGDEIGSQSESNDEKYGQILWPIAIISFAFVLVFLYDGLQGLENEYILVFLKRKTAHSDARSMINVLFWSSYSIGRLLSILASIKLTPQFMLVLNIIGCQLAALIYYGAASQFMNGTDPSSIELDYSRNYQLIVIATVVIGLAMSSITPTVITMTENFLEINGVMMSVIIGGAALGEMVIPLIEGQFIDEDADSFLYNIIIAVGLSWVFYIGFWLSGRATDKFSRGIHYENFVFSSRDHIRSVDSSNASEMEASGCENHDNAAFDQSEENGQRYRSMESSQ